MSDTAPLLAQYVNANHVLSNSSLCAIGWQIMNESQRECESRPHSSLCVSRQSHSQPPCLRLSSTELRKERISTWSDSVHFVHSKDLFLQTHTWPTQHYKECVWKFIETKTELNECYWQEHIGSLKWHTHMQSGLWYVNIIRDRKQTKHENKYWTEKNFIPAPLQLLHATLMSFLIVNKKTWSSKLNQLKTV